MSDEIAIGGPAKCQRCGEEIYPDNCCECPPEEVAMHASGDIGFLRATIAERDKRIAELEKQLATATEFAPVMERMNAALEKQLDACAKRVKELERFL